MNSKCFPGFQRGVTLIEICVVLAIVSILVGTAVPSFDNILKSHRLDGQAAELALDLRYIRSEAVARNQGVRASFHNAPGGTCTMIHTGTATDCQCDANGGGQCSNGAVLLKSVGYRMDAGVAVHANVASMRFDPYTGTVTPTGTVTVASINGQEVRHVVNIIGRVRSCSPGGSVTYVKPC